jgi:hypothetical protein
VSSKGYLGFKCTSLGEGALRNAGVYTHQSICTMQVSNGQCPDTHQW